MPGNLVLVSLQLSEPRGSRAEAAMSALTVIDHHFHNNLLIMKGSRMSAQLWHNDYFELKATEKLMVQEKLSAFPLFA